MQPEFAIDPHHPWHVAFQGYSILVANPDGSFDGHGREGLFDFDTRILSAYRIELDGRRPQHVSSGLASSERWIAQLRVPRSGGDPEGPILPQDTLELAIERRLGRGMAETMLVRNHSMAAIETELVLFVDADFADVLEVGTSRRQTGDVRVVWNPDARTLRFDYRVERKGRTLHRALRIRVDASDSPPAVDGRSLRFTLRLPPRGEWRASVGYHSLVDATWREPDGFERERVRDIWRARRAGVEAAGSIVGPAFERAAEDLFALRAWELDEAPDAWFTMAGVPTYGGLFGRDSLTAAWQGALIGPEMMRGALAATARTQATEDDAFREAEPGKMIHEMRRGPLAELDIVPQRAYYGTQTTPAMFVLALSEHWHWTADDALLRHHRDAALRALDWAERYGDRDGDGLLEYVKRSPEGGKNQGWKDSDEAIRYPDGAMVPNPIATIEEQAYHFIALQRMAEILLALGEDDNAERFLARARSLGTRIHEAFWIEEDGFYAMALDPDKVAVRSIGSDPGHALAAGVVPERYAERMTDRLLAPDLFSGWGVRTLSSDHPSYNPWGYHLGTVWPVENATFALGMKRYGLDAQADRIVRGMLEASACFRSRRLPEALSGHPRDESLPPSAYPGSNSPQAWSASATVQLVQIMLGLYPFAAANVLALVRPRLPESLPTVTVRRLRVGAASVSIRFERRKDGSADHEVLDTDGRLQIVTVPPPQDVRPKEESRTDRLKGWFLDHAPGRTASALRIALGGLEL